MEASRFARWLIFSGMAELFKAHPQDGFHKVDGWLLDSKTQTLIQMCNDRLATGSKSPQFEHVEFQSLHHKVDLIAGYLAKLTVAPSGEASGPVLTVLEGGNVGGGGGDGGGAAAAAVPR